MAEFSECSKTNGFSFVMHCRKAKDDMVLFTSFSLHRNYQVLVLFYHFPLFLERSVIFGITLKVVFFLGGLSKRLDGQTRVCGSSHWRVPQWKKVMLSLQRRLCNCMDHYQLWTNQTCFNSSHFRETGTKQKRYDRVGKDVTSDITRVVFRESSLLEIRQIRL